MGKGPWESWAALGGREAALALQLQPLTTPGEGWGAQEGRQQRATCAAACAGWRDLLPAALAVPRWHAACGWTGGTGPGGGRPRDLCKPSHIKSVSENGTGTVRTTV